MEEPKKQPNRIFLREHSAMKIIEVRLHDVINTKQKTIASIKETFEGENMKSEYYVL